MKKIFKCGLAVPVFLFLSLIFSNVNAQNSGYDISIKWEVSKNQTLVLGHYFGEQFFLDAEATADEKGKVVFSGDTNLEPGIYMVSFNDSDHGHEHYIDFLINKNQRFSVLVESTDGHQFKLSFENSPENDLLSEYKAFIAEKETEIFDRREKLDVAENHQDSSIHINRLNELDLEIRAYRDALAEKHPQAFLSKLLVALREPLLPNHLQNPSNPKDSTEAKQFIKENFWKDVNFWETGLANTPYLDGKLDRYFSEILEMRVDSVIPAIDEMMNTAIASERMSQLILTKLLYGSMYHRFKWKSEVYIHIFEKYIASENHSWMSAEEKDMFSQHAYLLMGNTKGAPATDIELPDEKGNQQTLFGNKGKYTVLAFWDPTCDHCVETLPKMDSLFQEKWQSAGIEVFSVAVESEGTRDDWLNFLQEKELNNWTNVYHAAAENFKPVKPGYHPPLKRYDVWYFPAFFLLDNENRLMAKKLSYPQMVDLIDSLLEQKAANQIKVSSIK